jgi:alkylhydroperoxidase/carboxymuconolactone decarboxylase family protein YurZ
LSEEPISAEGIVAQMKRELGSRRWHAVVARYDADVLRRYHDNFMKIRELPALPVAMKELIIVAVDCCQFWPGVKAHIHGALKAGATESQVAEAIITAGIPGGVHAMAFGLEALDDVLAGWRPATE